MAQWFGGPSVRGRRVVRVCVVIAVVVVVALAVGSQVPGPDRTGDSVVILGDSVTAMGEGQMTENLGSAYDVLVDGFFGARIGDRVVAAQDHAVTQPDQVVVNLGTNDVVVGTPIDVAAGAMESILTALDDVECVHVVTVGRNLVSDGVPLPKQSAAVNEVIVDAVRRHPNAELVHWDRAQEAAAIRRGNPTALTSDGVHPDLEGQAVLTDAYADALSDCGRAWFLP